MAWWTVLQLSGLALCVVGVAIIFFGYPPKEEERQALLKSRVLAEIARDALPRFVERRHISLARQVRRSLPRRVREFPSPLSVGCVLRRSATASMIC
jgi:hypothetical protein